jgi:hypothetical protein
MGRRRVGKEIEPGTQRDDQQNRPTLQLVDGPREQLEGRWIDPVRIFQDEQHGALLRKPVQVVDERRQGALLLIAGRKLECRVATVEGQRQERREQRGYKIDVRRRLHEEPFQLVELDTGSVVLGKPGRALELGDHGIERTVRMMG